MKSPRLEDSALGTKITSSSTPRLLIVAFSFSNLAPGLSRNPAGDSITIFTSLKFESFVVLYHIPLR